MPVTDVVLERLLAVPSSAREHVTLKAVVRRSPTLYHAAKTIESSLLAARRALWIAARPTAVDRYLAGHSLKKLQIGTGEFPTSGWLNTDIDPTLAHASKPEGPPVIFLDATRRFPFADATFRFPFADATFHYVYHEHLIEHLSYEAARSMLGECGRVLRPGARIRIATPDMARLLGLYEHRNNPSPEEAEYVRWVPAKYLGDPSRAAVPFILNNAFRAWHHQFLFDEETLRAMLAKVGFTDPLRYAVGESDDPELRGLETHGRAAGSEAMVAFETMVLEAERPASFPGG